jgi:DNA-binding XRE family transcriptional regulator
MTHRIKSVRPLENFVLSVVFQNGVEKEYDMRRLYPVFPQFKDFEKITGLFEQVKVDAGGYGISWNDELDLDAEDIWEDGIETSSNREADIMSLLAENLMRAREEAGMTQRQLAEAVGIYQADISKIERGISNPSVSTLNRLAEGLGMKLKIEFHPRQN